MKFEFELKNKSEDDFEVELFFEETVDPHIIAFSPEKCISLYFLFLIILLVFLNVGESQKIEFSIKMICTARIDSSIIVASHGRGYCLIPFRSESSPSCFLSLGEIKLGRILGKGAYAFSLVDLLTFFTLIQIWNCIYWEVSWRGSCSETMCDKQ